MKILAALIAAAMIIPAILPSHFNVEREIIINSPREDAFSYLVNLESWQEWSPWLAQEPTAEHSFHGTPGVVGSYTQWNGEVIGAGKQTLTTIEEPKYLEMKLEFTKPNQSEATGYMKFSDTAEGVQIIWGIKGELSYPVERVMGPFMDSMIGKEFETGLNSLKGRLEATQQ